MAADVELSQWCSRQLSQILDCQTGEEVAEYLLTMETSQDIEEYLLELLDKDDPKVKQFIRELLRRWKQTTADNVQIYKKATEESLIFMSGKENTKPQQDVKKSAPRIASLSVVPNEKNKGSNPQVRHPVSQKKVSKFVPLHSQEGVARQSVQLPGRHHCDCQAQKHALVNNCTECGRIVCVQEGSGPCSFCGMLVCTREEQEALARDSKRSQKLKERLLNKSFEATKQSRSKPPVQSVATRMNEGLEKAMKHKNTLLEYDKTSAQRTHVIDDESDYFATDSKWLSKQERQTLKKKEEELRDLRHASRLKMKVTLDFAGRQVLNDDHYSGIYDRRTVTSSEGKNGTDLVDPTHSRQRPQDIRPMFTSSLSESQTRKKPQVDCDGKKNMKNQLRIQDRELMEMSDQGMCLSMHQPWASLLVRGIKRVEGRSWYTAHRGPLWIAATVKTPTSDDITSLENFYKMTYPDETLDFPEDYPSGCLLGCVEVVDCLEEEEYKQKFPNGESESNHVFIVENPRELKLKFQVKGKHKIWKLDPHVHSAAKKSINHI